MQLGLTDVDGPADDRPDVVDVRLEAVEERYLAAARHVRGDSLDHREIGVGIPPPDRCRVDALIQPVPANIRIVSSSR